MRTNANITIYSRGVDPVTRGETWTRLQVRGVAWEDQRGAFPGKSGNLEADAVVVYIPMVRMATAVKAGDVMVKGLISDTISPIFTITALKAKYPGDCATIRTVDKLDLGSINMRHWQIGAS